MAGSGTTRYASELGELSEANKRSRSENMDEDQFNTAPSRVVHVRSLPLHTTQGDIAQALNIFGAISYIVMVSTKGQALVELGSIEAATALVNYAQTTPLQINGRRIYVNFSKHQELQRKEPTVGADAPDATPVLLMTIMNAVYPITVDAIHQICTPFGNVLRIVIFVKSTTQVLVEFATVASAARAKASLDGADIYAGCCTLRIEFSRTARLNVRRNDEMSWDYTLAGGPAPQQRMGGPPPPTDYRNGGPPQGMHMSGGPHMGGPPPHMGGPGPVIMIYGLNPDRMNAQRLFNIMCCYGNVVRIKFLIQKPGTAMVQFENGMQADAAMQNLHNLEMFGDKLTVSPSKHAYIGGSTVGMLPDNTFACVDFEEPMLRRFRQRVERKNRIHAPGKVLHFYNAPHGCTREQILDAFTRHGVPLPVEVSFLETVAPDKPPSGLIEWGTPHDALEAIVICNHMKLSGADGAEAVFKLAFSPAQSAQRSAAQHTQQPHAE